MTTTRTILTAALLLVSAAALPAQAVPEGWSTVADDGVAADSVRFVAMAPGWHLSPGPAGLIWQPSTTVEGPFRVEYEAYRFPGEPSGYGVFLGGRGLEPATYDFFEVLLDARGRYRVGHRAGPDWHEIVPWTAHDAIAVPTADGTAHNALTIEASPDRFAVSVNGVELTAFDPPGYARFDGVVGLRVLDGVNVHVARLDVTPLATAPEDDPGR